MRSRVCVHCSPLVAAFYLKQERSMIDSERAALTYAYLTSLFQQRRQCPGRCRSPTARMLERMAPLSS
jgi:hypothetical protein